MKQLERSKKQTEKPATDANTSHTSTYSNNESKQHL